MLLYMMISMSFLFIISFHPILLVIILILQTIMTAILIGMLSKSFWFSYILFLIFVGSMLILFIYIISMIYNKKFNKTNLSLMILPLPLLIFTLNKTYNMETMNMNFYLLENSINLNKLYNFPMNLITIFIITYLFFLMITVVKITNFYIGPLRIKI